MGRTTGGGPLLRQAQQATDKRETRRVPGLDSQPNCVPKRLPDGSVKRFLYHRATGIRLDPERLAETYVEAGRKSAVQSRHSRNPACRSRRNRPRDPEALTWTVDKAQRVIDACLARRGVLAANAIAKLEDSRDKNKEAAG